MTVPTPDQPDQTGDSAIDLSQLSLDEATRAYRRELHVHCYRMLGSLEEAEDLVQETYLRAWRANPDVAHLDNPRAWLYKVATNRAVFFLTGFTHRPCATLTPRRPLSQPPVARLAFPRVGRRRSRPPTHTTHAERIEDEMNPNQTPAEEYRELAGRFTQLVEAVPDEADWTRPAPPEGWTARDVVRHLVEWFPPFLQQGAGITLPAGPDVDVDPVGAWQTFNTAVQTLLDDPATQAKTFAHVHTGELPLPQAISRFFTADVFMHSWDLARATGQDDTLDPERCAMMLEGMQPFDDALRASGQYGRRVEVAADADPQTRLLAFIGRDSRP